MLLQLHFLYVKLFVCIWYNTVSILTWARPARCESAPAQWRVEDAILTAGFYAIFNSGQVWISLFEQQCAVIPRQWLSKMSNILSDKLMNELMNHYTDE